jgi:predicted RNase H-like HicB family nuclease
MLTEYIDAAMRHATYEMIEDDNPYYGEIPECLGAWANAASLEKCRIELRSVLEDWILFHVRDRAPLPVVDGIDMTGWARTDEQMLVPEEEW